MNLSTGRILVIGLDSSNIGEGKRLKYILETCINFTFKALYSGDHQQNEGSSTEPTVVGVNSCTIMNPHSTSKNLRTFNPFKYRINKCNVDFR